MKKKYADGGMFREGMPVPQDVDGASVTPGPRKPMMKRPPMKKPTPKGGGMFREGMPVPQDVDGGSAPKAYKKGGSIDGIAQRGKTRGKMC